MRKLLAGAAIVVMAGLILVPAQADEPYCALANVQAGDDGAIGASCKFTAGATPHGYVGATLNDFRIYVESGDDPGFDAKDTVLADVSPTGPEPSAGSFNVATNTEVTVEIINGCAEVACGWAGALVVG